MAIKVGELARRAGVTVRTLHHYESIGLLVPSARTRSGHRLYLAGDVARLARIRALGALGMSLDEISRCLDDDRMDPLHLVETHLARARELLDEQHALVTRLEALRARLTTSPDDVERFIETVEVMTMIERYYTKEQLETLARRREALGEGEIAKVEDEWQALFEAVREVMAAGETPDGARARALAARWSELRDRTIAGFTGGDPGLRASLDTLYAKEPVAQIHPSFDPAIFRFMNEACAAASGE